MHKTYRTSVLAKHGALLKRSVGLGVHEMKQKFPQIVNEPLKMFLYQYFAYLLK
jgi:hypothetical protein